MKNFNIIIFLGVDGSGKSTLINAISNSNKKKFHTIHFIPDFFRKNKKSITNPHGKKKRSKIYSFIKVIYWLINFKLFAILNRNSKKIFIFDRYIYDVIIDPLRYRFSLSEKMTNIFLKYIIKPDLIVLLSGNPKKIYVRKKELKLKEIIRLNTRYNKFVQKFNSKIILNSFSKINYNKKKILNYIKKIK